MKINELLLDKIASTKLFEMARSRKDAKDLITSLSPQIINHIIKLFLFDSAENKRYWIKEIDSWLNQVDDVYLKPSNKKPDNQTIYNWFIFDSSPHYDVEYIDGKVKKWVSTEYKNFQVHDYDTEFVLNQILKIIKQVSRDISVPNKFISINDYLN